jgi:hypothetical protein
MGLGDRASTCVDSEYRTLVVPQGGGALGTSSDYSASYCVANTLLALYWLESRLRVEIAVVLYQFRGDVTC